MDSKICLKFLFCYFLISSTMPSIFCILVGGGQIMPICLLVYSRFLTTRTELSSHNRDCEAHRAKHGHYLPLTEKLVISNSQSPWGIY